MIESTEGETKVCYRNGYRTRSSGSCVRRPTDCTMPPPLEHRYENGNNNGCADMFNAQLFFFFFFWFLLKVVAGYSQDIPDGRPYHKALFSDKPGINVSDSFNRGYHHN